MCAFHEIEFNEQPPVWSPALPCAFPYSIITSARVEKVAGKSGSTDDW
jgi:hypothetical protein